MHNLLSDSFEISQGQTSGDRDVELGAEVSMGSTELGLEGFFKKVEEIDKQIEKLSVLFKKLEDANEESKAVTKASVMKSIKQRMEKDIDEVLKTARAAKLKLEELDKDNLLSREKPGCGKGSASDRSRMSTTVALKKKLKERMSDFQNLREKIRREYREVIERRVFTVTGNHADEETIDRLIETGNGEQIFQKAIQEQGRFQIVATLAEIQERHDAMREIEKRLLELQQVFNDMAVLIDAQGEILDNIETQVSSAVDHVQSGTTALQRAKVLQKKTRKCMCIAIILLVIIALVIVLGVIRPWSKN